MQAQAALAQRLQAGGVNGLNGGVLLHSHATPKHFLHWHASGPRASCMCAVVTWFTDSTLHVTGLDAIQEQQPYKGLSPGMLQALSQLGRLVVLPPCQAPDALMC